MAKRLKHKTVVCVGGGLTAGLVARQLTAQGIDTLVLERGPDRRNSAADRIPTQRDELRFDTRQELAQDWSVKTYTLRHTPQDRALPLRRLEAFVPGEGLGGAATHWDGHMWRWLDHDPILKTHLERRYGKRAIPSDLLLQDWGVTYSDLEPYYNQFEKLFGVSGKAGNLKGKLQAGGNPFEAPRQEEYPQPPMERTEAGVIFSAAAKKLGYTPFPLPAATSSGYYTNPDGMSLGQCQYCGHCERHMCEAQAKATPEGLLYPVLAGRPSFELRLSCYVTHVDYDRASKRVIGVRYIDLLSGEEYEQPADVVVLSSFTFQNNAFLLMSKIGEPYDPVARKGVVGKNLCFQSMGNVKVFHKDWWINPFLSGGGTITTIDDWNSDNFDHSGLGFFGGANIRARVSTGRPILLAPQRVPPGTPQWGTAWKKALADWYTHSFAITTQGSWYGHRWNYLDLDPTYTDAYGQPLVRMTFDVPENEARMSAYVTKKTLDIAKATGATIISPGKPAAKPFDTRVYQTTHISGGTTMGTDPATSVVSPSLQHWDAQNLFIVGGSVLTHNGGNNPSGTIAALALRLGDQLVDYVAKPRTLTQ